MAELASEAFSTSLVKLEVIGDDRDAACPTPPRP